MYKESKLGIDFNRVNYAKGVSKQIAENVQQFVEEYTTVAVERTLCRLVGIDGIDGNGVPLPNVVVDEIHAKGLLSQGALYFLGNAVIETGNSPEVIAQLVGEGKNRIHKDECLLCR